MTYSIIENSLMSKIVNIFNTSTNSNSSKYYAGKNAVQILVNNAKDHLISISKFDSNIIYYNLTTSSIEKTITSISLPVAGLISSDDNYLYVIEGNSYMLYKISLKTPTPVVTNIKLSIKPVRFVINSSNSKIYLAGNGYTNMISVVDTATFAESSLIPFKVKTVAHIVQDFKITSDDSTLIYLNRYSRNIITIALATNTVNEFNLDGYAPSIYTMSCVLSSDNSTLYVLGRFRFISYVVKLSLSGGALTYSAVQTLPTREVSITLSSDGSLLYLCNSINSSMDILATSNLSIQPSINLSNRPYYFFINSATNVGYAVNKYNGKIISINLSTNTVVSNYNSSKIITAITAADI